MHGPAVLNRRSIWPAPSSKLPGDKPLHGDSTVCTTGRLVTPSSFASGHPAVGHHDDVRLERACGRPLARWSRIFEQDWVTTGLRSRCSTSSARCRATALEVRDLRMRYGTTDVLTGVSFTARPVKCSRCLAR